MNDVTTVTPQNPAKQGDDPFRDSYADPELLAPEWGSMYRADPFDAQPPNMINKDVSTVDPLAGIKTPGFATIQVQNIESDLMTLRAELPFLTVLKFPQEIKTTFLGTAKAPATITVPTGAILVKFVSPDDFYVSQSGNAIVPDATSFTGNQSFDTDQFAGFYVYRESAYYYCGGVKQLSVVAPNANTPVQAIFIMRPSPNQGT